MIPFNYTDVADGAAWVRIIGWIVLAALIAGLVLVLRGNAGLAGSVSGSTLTIQPGLAIDQYGEPLVLTTARTIPLPPTLFF